MKKERKIESVAGWGDEQRHTQKSNQTKRAIEPNRKNDKV